jgi:hypothetical protein
MLLRKRKGQAMTEFALILPLLLLLLLGIIEAARVIWAYVTVQQAAREATRFAVTGRPFIEQEDIPGQLTICEGTATEKNVADPGVAPWLCAPEDRVKAIKAMAIRQGRTLNVSVVCDDPGEFTGTCSQQPGAFGVLVEGQTVTGTVTSEIQTVVNHPGRQGLLVQVSTFYNVEMITPVYDLLMGGNYLTLRGGVQMQNEGLDTALGIEPPPPIEPLDPLEGDSDPLAGDPTIEPDLYTVDPTLDLGVTLENHTANKTYNIYLFNPLTSQEYQICTATTDGNGAAAALCPLGTIPGAPAPDGVDYELYSKPSDAPTGPRTATAPLLVKVVIVTTPNIEFVEGQSVWAAGTTTPVQLNYHLQTDSAKYDVYLFRSDGTYLAPVKEDVTWDNGPFDWKAPDVLALTGTKCDYRGSSSLPCIIRSYRDGDYTPGVGNPLTNMYASTQVFINQPKVLLVPDAPPYKAGSILRVYLEGHTPNRSYAIYLTGGPPNANEFLGPTPEMNAFGDSTEAVAWPIPGGCGGLGGWPDGFYNVVSKTFDDIEMAKKTNVEFKTPPDPFIVVDGGDLWPAGSLIRIEVHNHSQNAFHYLEFNGQRIPTSNADDTFETNSCGFAAIDYVIPLSTSPATYQIKSFLATGPQPPNYPAIADVTVTITPIIEVLEGDKVMPDETITIRLRNHRPNVGYRVIYANKILFEVKTDSTGEAEVEYDLTKLPTTPPPDLSNSSNYGQFYELYSENTENDQKEATTQLALQGADLKVTKVEFPPASALKVNSMVPVTVTVKNVMTVPINSYFDIDFYFNPYPVNPTYYKGYNFPGDVKYWRNSVAAAGQPGDTFTIQDQFYVGEYGLQTVYGFADTSNYILEGEAGNLIANANNVLANSVTVSCAPATTNLAFGSLPSGWSTQRFGNADKGGGPSLSGGSNKRLILSSDGTGNMDQDDNTRGELFYYRNTQVLSGTNGLDVYVQLYNVDLEGGWAKGGIEIRNSLSSTSPRVLLGVARNNGANSFVIQPAYREAGGGTSWSPKGSAYFQANHANKNFGTPIWLRIERVAGTTTFNYYYRQDSASPPADPAAAAAWWGSPVDSVTIDSISDSVYVGLFNSPYADGNSGVGSSTFDNLTIVERSNCPAALGQPTEDDELPPGLTLCADPLKNQSFETSLIDWIVASGQGVSRSAGSANSGNFKLLAPTFASFSTNPWFYQQFIMTDWVISTTTAFELSLAKNINNLTDDQPEDQFYAVVTTNPSSIANALASKITTPTVVANGVMGGGAYNQTKWDPVKVTLPIINKNTIESYAEQPLYLFFYNNSNQNQACGAGNRCDTQYFFDDVRLSPCTTQPLPPNVETRLTGELLLHFSGSPTPQKLPYVKVWAYTPGDNTMYETMTLPNGEFNFYNLPATAAGTEYVVFSMYHLVDIEDQSQIETLTADTKTVLKQGIHTLTTPQRVALDLFELIDIP